jgi:hypothetical protein
VTEPIDQFEAQLRRLEPRPLDDLLVEEIGSRLSNCSQPKPQSDGLLWCAISCSAAAACLIIGIIAHDSFVELPNGPAVVIVRPSAPMGDYQQALARADMRWGDELR